MLDRTPSRRDLEASATVETLSLRGHRARAEPSQRVISAPQRAPRQPEDPGPTSHDRALSGWRDLHVSFIPQRRLTLTVGFCRLVVGTPSLVAPSCQQLTGFEHGWSTDRSPYPPFVHDAALEELPRFVPPMLATAGPAPSEPGWAPEVKWAACARSSATTAVACACARRPRLGSGEERNRNWR